MRKSLARLSGRKPRKTDADDADKNQIMYIFAPNEDAWVSNPEIDHDWIPCKVLSQAGIFATVRLENKRSIEQIDVRQRALLPRNHTVESDMTSLHHINEPCMLYNLEQRAYDDQPYTFMGNILVAVNPLKHIPDPEGALGSRSAANTPHPFAVAEFAFQQMSFAGDNRKHHVDNDSIINQSVVTSGESGAGKTESSKMVLHHLVQRTLNLQASDKLTAIDQRLLDSNPITEAFGNASTLRNGNSSRFGKFMKLHFEQIDSPRGEPAVWKISAASVKTYLLERSRVTIHEEGERNYHCFYLMLAGMDGNMLSELGLEQAKSNVGFRYLSPDRGTNSSDFSPRAFEDEMHKTDSKRFEELVDALDALGFNASECDAIWRVLAGVLHLGNISFRDEEAAEGDIAKVISLNGSYDPLGAAAEMLGIEEGSLERLLIQRILSMRDGDIVTPLNANSASFARDAVAKGLYSALFDHIVNKINMALDETAGSVNPNDLPFIGVLDIFGFESFRRNGFEQLLINYTNESLQATFNKKVFEAELSLYEREGLIIDQTMNLPPGNEPAMELLAGKLKNPGTDDPTRQNKDSILMDLDDQCRAMDPSDTKLLKVYNKKFAKHPCYNNPKIHPQYAHERFRIRHYAGAVVYTVDKFLVKNNDALPKEANDLFAGSSSPILAEEFETRVKEAAKSGNGKRNVRSIVRAFRSQIIELTGTLDATACSFIRCVKPNAEMKRGKSDSWFDRAYVGHQLKHLSIPQTAVVLRSGLPTRIAYSSLVDTYKSVLPKDAIHRAKLAGNGEIDSKMFVTALFWAFEIPRNTFKLGHTRVFFKAGELSSLDKVLQEAGLWVTSTDPDVVEKKNSVVQRFRLYYSRMKFRHAAVNYLARQYFVVHLFQERRAAAICIQKNYRMWKAQAILRKMKRSKQEAEEEERRQREEEERRQREEEERRQREEEERQALEAEMERAAQDEVRRIREALTRHKTIIAEQRAARDDDDDDPDHEFVYQDVKSIPASVSSSRSKKMRTPTRVATMRMGAYEPDDDDDHADSEDLNEAEDLVGVTTHAGPDVDDETDEERLDRISKEVYEDALRATAREVDELEASGEEVDDQRRAEIREKYERQFEQEQAEYEIRRQRNEELRANASKYWAEISDSIGGGLKNAKLAASGVVKGLVDGAPAAFLDPATRKKFEQHPAYQQLKNSTDEYHANLSRMTSQRVLAAEEELEHNINRKERVENGDAPPQPLRKKSTHAGLMLEINPKEMDAPTESARKQLEVLKGLVESGVITPEEMARMVKDMNYALERRNSEISSQGSEYEGDSTIDDSSVLIRPEKEVWLGEPLPFQHGSFFLRIKNEIATEISIDGLEIKLFVFECAWQDDAEAWRYGRWRVKARKQDLEELSIALQKEKSKVFKLPRGRSLPDFPAKSRTSGSFKRGALAMLFKRRSSPARQTPLLEQSSSRELALENFVQEAQEYMSEILTLASRSHFNKKNHPIFSVSKFSDLFDTAIRVGDIRLKEVFRERGPYLRRR